MNRLLRQPIEKVALMTGSGGGAAEPSMNSENENWPAARKGNGEGHCHRARRRRHSVAGKTILFSCLIAAAYSGDEASKGECAENPTEPGSNDFCEGPRVVKFNLNPPGPAASRGEAPQPPQLGDGIRSAEASGIFFNSLDTDGDGAIEPEEVARFLQNEIGGKQFDTQVQVDEEVGTIMKRLDQNHNNGLEMSDMLNYWIQLESLLTAEEVAEWIVYSVQLPSSVGMTFLENGITGYDFLEIVDNGGEVLQNELGIDKVSFRNKIVRQMQTRMLGIGSSPDTPQKFSHKLEGCKAVTLSWERSIARVFPVHSYRLQRRAINLYGGTGGNESSNEVNPSNAHIFDASFNSDWKTVYVGGESEFVDSGLETGHNYMYRIQAWNSVGRSGWETIDLSQALKKKRCSTTKPSRQQLATERGIPTSLNDDMWDGWMSNPRRIFWGLFGFIQFMYASVKFVLAFFAMLAGIMRFRRATATSSTTASSVLPFPRVWKAVNRISTKVSGYEIIPRTLVGDKNALRLQDDLHDARINATGLRGYDRLREKSKHVSGSNGLGRRAALRKANSASDVSASVSFLPPPEVIVTHEQKPLQNRFAWKGSTRKVAFATRSVSEVSESSSAFSSFSPSLKNIGSGVSKSDHPISGYHRHSSSAHDDLSKCSECLKRFKLGKRYKHHCSRCMATFCHKHGLTTHSNFTSCKVPGDCICNSCLFVLSERSEREAHRSTSSCT